MKYDCIQSRRAYTAGATVRKTENLEEAVRSNTILSARLQDVVMRNDSASKEQLAQALFSYKTLSVEHGAMAEELEAVRGQLADAKAEILLGPGRSTDMAQEMEGLRTELSAANFQIERLRQEAEDAHASKRDAEISATQDRTNLEKAHAQLDGKLGRSATRSKLIGAADLRDTIAGSQRQANSEATSSQMSDEETDREVLKLREELAETRNLLADATANLQETQESLATAMDTVGTQSRRLRELREEASSAKKRGGKNNNDGVRVKTEHEEGRPVSPAARSSRPESPSAAQAADPGPDNPAPAQRIIPNHDMPMFPGTIAELGFSALEVLPFDRWGHFSHMSQGLQLQYSQSVYDVLTAEQKALIADFKNQRRLLLPGRPGVETPVVPVAPNFTAVGTAPPPAAMNQPQAPIAHPPYNGLQLGLAIDTAGPSRGPSSSGTSTPISAPSELHALKR